MNVNKPVRRAALLSLVALAGSSASAATAGAQSAANPANVALEPVGKAQKLQYTADPGTELSGAVRVQNGTARARVFRLSAVDVGTAALGGAVYGERDGRRTGRWLDLSTRSVSVGAQGDRVVRFRVRVPRNAAAGVHYAAITATDAEQLRAAGAAPSSTAKRIVVHRLARFALPIRIRVNGRGAGPRVELRDAKVNVDAAGANVFVKLENTGHTLVRSTRVNLRVKQGARTLFSATQPLREFVPDSVAQYPIPWTGAPKEGTYRLVGQIRPAGTPVIKIDARLKVNGRTVASARRSTAGRTSPPAANSGISLVVWLAMGAVTTVAVMFAFAFVRMRRRLLAATAHDQKRPS